MDIVVIGIKTTSQKSIHFSVLPVINTTCTVTDNDKNKHWTLTSAFQLRTAVNQHHEKSLVEIHWLKIQKNQGNYGKQGGVCLGFFLLVEFHLF